MMVYLIVVASVCSAWFAVVLYEGGSSPVGAVIGGALGGGLPIVAIAAAVTSSP